MPATSTRRSSRSLPATSPRTERFAAQLQQAQKEVDALGVAMAARRGRARLQQSADGHPVGDHRSALWDLGEATASHAALLHAEQATVGAAALTSRLLAFSRGAVVAMEEVDAHRALSGLTELLPRALGVGIELDVRLDADLPPIIAAPVQLEQILLNLAINARDAMPDGGKVSVVARSRRLAGGRRGCNCRPGEWLDRLDVQTTAQVEADRGCEGASLRNPSSRPSARGTEPDSASTCWRIVRTAWREHSRCQAFRGRGPTVHGALAARDREHDCPSSGDIVKRRSHCIVCIRIPRA